MIHSLLLTQDEESQQVRLLVRLQEEEEKEEVRGIPGPGTVSPMTHKVTRKQIVPNHKSQIYIYPPLWSSG